MNYLLLVHFIPLLSALFLALPLKHSEKFITRFTTLSLALPFLASICLVTGALWLETFPLEIVFARITLLGHVFPFIAWLDHNTVALLTLTHVLGLLVVKFSQGYLHLEKGYQRFFSTILFFIFGMELLSLAGHMDLFFAGWEIVGFSSFLLIAFYRTHARSVTNAWRIYNLYRVCDLGILIGAVLGHVLWHEATRFSTLNAIPPEIFSATNQAFFTFLCVSIVFASLGKSAQFPFHNWPARAMEGPTPSSAIFYGALSIHAGVFLLLRTQPIWSQSLAAISFIALAGFLTLFFSSIQGQIQTNIKGQIAYASTAQVGIMFIELGFGLNKIVLVHLICHALYRCFQLLVSPSVVASSSSLNNNVVVQRIRNRKSLMDTLTPRMRNTIYVLGMTDFSMDISWRGFGFLPWRATYRKLNLALGHPLIPFFMLGMYLLSILMLFIFKIDSNHSTLWTSSGLAAIALFLAFKALFFHQNPFLAMREMSLSILGCMAAAFLLDHELSKSIQVYLWSVSPCLLIALCICWKYRQHDLRVYHSLGTAHTFSANLFMLCFMVLAGMPVSTAFLGEDMLLEELIIHSPLMTSMVALCLMVSGLLCVKIYSRLFMGLPVQRYRNKEAGNLISGSFGLFSNPEKIRK